MHVVITSSSITKKWKIEIYIMIIYWQNSVNGVCINMYYFYNCILYNALVSDYQLTASTRFRPGSYLCSHGIYSTKKH